MKNWILSKILTSESGSAMLVALAAVAMIGLMTSATLTISGMLNQQAARATATDSVTFFSQAVETLSTNPTSCIGFINGPSKLDGLKFVPTGNQNCPPSTCLNQGTGVGHLKVTLDTTMTGSILGPTKNYIKATNQFVNQNIAVDDFYLTNLKPAGPLTVGDLYIQLSTLNPPTSFAPRLVGHMSLAFDASNNLTTCSSSASPQGLCESMGCVYNPTPTLPGDQQCLCGFPPMNCNPIPGVRPRKYIAGINPDLTPICKSVQFTCPVGLFLAGIDIGGNPVCLAAEGIDGGSPPPPSGPPPSVCQGYTVGSACATPNAYLVSPQNDTSNYCYCGGIFPDGTSGPPGQHVTWHAYCDASSTVIIQPRTWPGNTCP